MSKRMDTATRAYALLAIALTAMTATGPVWAQTEGSDAIERQALDIRDRFMAAVHSCGVVPTFEPRVVVKTHPGVVAYFPSDRSARLSRWVDMPPPIRGMMEAWAADGSLGLGSEAQFGEIFNSLLLAHELGHYLQHMSGRLEALDRWESEVEANRIAIAFWSLDPSDAARLPDRIENFATFLGKLPNPVPAGVEAREYFNANYKRLGDDSEAYGWYQGAFMRTAWAERGQTDFCSLAVMNAPAGQSARP